MPTMQKRLSDDSSGEPSTCGGKPSHGLRRVRSMLGSSDSANSSLTEALSRDVLQDVDSRELGHHLRATSVDPAQSDDSDSYLSVDDLADLASAFQACDEDDNGTIEPAELVAMLNVVVREPPQGFDDAAVALMKEAKREADAWTREQDAMGPRSVGHINLREQVGGTPSRHGLKRHHAALAIKAQSGRNFLLAGLRSTQSHLLSTLHETKRVAGTVIPGAEGAMNYSQRVASMSYEMAKKTSGEIRGTIQDSSPYQMAKQTGVDIATAAKKTGEDVATLAGGIVNNVRDKMASRGAVYVDHPDANLSFNEFIYLMQSKKFQRLVQLDWHTMARMMRGYRHAFDTTDVDGNHVLEFEELEMALLAIDPHKVLSSADVDMLWSMLASPAAAQRRSNDPSFTKTSDFVHGNKDIKLDFMGFLQGMAVVQRDRNASMYVNVLKPNRWELLSLIIDTPVSRVEEQRIVDQLSRIEQVGFKMVMNRSVGHEMDTDNMRTVLKRAGQGQLRLLDSQQLDRMRTLNIKAILVCAMIGLIFSAFPAAIENVLSYELAADGFADAYWVCHVQSMLLNNGTATPADDVLLQTTPMNPDVFLCTTVAVNASSCLDSAVLQYAADEDHYFPPGTDPWNPGADADQTSWITMEYDRFGPNTMDRICKQCACAVCGCAHHANGEIQLTTDNTLLTWWLVYTPSLISFALCEICLLFYCAMRYTTQVAWALDIRLSPVNADRAFVTNALTRCAFELGNSNASILGVDPGQSTGDGKKLVLMLLYKSKVVLTGLLLKLVVAHTCSIQMSYWWKPWLGMVVATVCWDAFTAYSIMMQARIKGVGVYASVELFNEVMDRFYPGYTSESSTVSKLTSVQIARAIGICIVVHGSLHPSMELLLRHSIQFLGMRGASVIAVGGVLDDYAGFLDDLKIESPTVAEAFEDEAANVNPVFEEESEQPQPQTHHRMDVLVEYLRGSSSTLTKVDQQAILSVLLLAALMDGDLNRTELKMWRDAVDAVGPAIATYNEDRIELLCDRYGIIAAATHSVRTCARV